MKGHIITPRRHTTYANRHSYSQTFFICRRTNFIPLFYTRLLLFNQPAFYPNPFTINKAAFDHEGWAVGVAALRGHFIDCDIESDYIFATFNNGTLRNDNKVFTSAPSSVGFAATFSPRTKAFDGCAVVYTKDVYTGASARYARLRNEKHIATLGMTQFEAYYILTISNCVRRSWLT